MNPRQKLTLNVRLAPTTTRVLLGTLQIGSNSSDGETALEGVTGTGTATPQLMLSTTNLGFGNVNTNSSTTLPITLTSTGTGPVKINFAVVSGAGFSLSGGTFPVTLNPKQTMTLNVKFAPTAAIAVTGTLTISSNALRHATAMVGLSGTGMTAKPQLMVSTINLGFGNVNTNSSSTLPVTLTSTGTGPVKINSAVVSGTGFSVSKGTFPLTLNPKQTMTLNVKFAPTATGAVTGTLTVSSNALRHTTATVGLGGTGTTPTTTLLGVSPSSLSFGNVNVNASATLPLTLTSTGTGPVRINSTTVNGTGFSISGGSFPVTLNSKQVITLQVRFAPTTTGAATGKVTITSDSTTGGTAEVNLTGTGTAAQHEVDLSWSPPSNSAVPIVGYNIYRSTGSNTSYQKLNSAVSLSDGYADKMVQSGASYSYIVKSVGMSGIESSPSNQVIVTIP